MNATNNIPTLDFNVSGACLGGPVKHDGKWGRAWEWYYTCNDQDLEPECRTGGPVTIQGDLFEGFLT